MYVRDNIHVSLLSVAYQRFVTGLTEQPGYIKLNPSGYVETQREFAERMAREFRARTEMQCKLEFGEQADFSEPLVRHNNQPVDGAKFGWSESAAWDEFARYYQHPLTNAVGSG
jgi:UDP-glucose 4-epimerase